MAVAGVGFLSQVTNRIRKYCDDRGMSVKFSDAELLTYVQKACGTVFGDLNRADKFKPKARVPITFVESVQYYELPGNFGTFLALERLDPTTGEVLGEIIPRSPLHPRGPMIEFEENFLRTEPKWGYTEGPLYLKYVPRGDVTAFEAVGTAWSPAGVTVNTVVAGTVDRSRNAYVGYTLHTLTGAPWEKRNVVTYGAATQEFAVEPALTIVTGNFEVVPSGAYQFMELIALRTAWFLAAITVDTPRRNSIMAEYTDTMRGYRLDRNNGEQRRGGKFERKTRGRLRTR